MADVLKAEGMVITATNSSGGVYPFACAKNSSISFSREFIELAPKTNSYSREYIKGRSSFTISGSGLIKLDQSNMQPFNFFEPFLLNTDTSFKCYLDLIDNQNNYNVYKFDCIFNDITLDSTYGTTPSYSYTLQGTGPITTISVVDSYSVTSGKITGRNTTTHKLVAIGYGGKWYYNYSVTSPSAGVYEILMSDVANGTTVKAAYLAL